MYQQKQQNVLKNKQGQGQGQQTKQTQQGQQTQQGRQGQRQQETQETQEAQSNWLQMSSPFFNNNNGLIYSVSSDWSSQQNMYGIRPPAPSVIYNNNNELNNYLLLPEPTDTHFNIIKINSLREPFATEFMVTQYGAGPVQRLGTSMGQ